MHSCIGLAGAARYSVVVRRMCRASVCALLLALSSSCAGSPVWPRLIERTTPVQKGADDALWVFRNVNVFTGVEAQPWLNAQDVWIRAGRIESVQPSGASLKEAAQIIEGAGKTLLPGYIDSHVHLGSAANLPWAPPVTESPEHNLSAYLYAGVTCVFDLGGDVARTLELRRQVDAGQLWGPRIFLTHRHITGPGSHPLPMAQEMVPLPARWLLDLWVDQIDTKEAARQHVQARIDAGVDYIKLNYDEMPPGTPKMDEQILRDAILISHRHKKRVVVHATASADIVTAAAAGADLIAHGPYRDLMSEVQARELASYQTPVILTLSGFEARALALKNRWVPHPMIRETTPAQILEPMLHGSTAHEREYPQLFAIVHAGEAARGDWEKSVTNMVQAGVPLFVGTDSALPGSYPGGSFHHELELMHRLGVPLTELLLGATSRPARWVQKNADFGQVRPGFIADLVLLDGDPRTDFGVLHDIVDVWRAGRRVPRQPISQPDNAL